MLAIMLQSVLAVTAESSYKCDQNIAKINRSGMYVYMYV